jgi:hypothetical protein
VTLANTKLAPSLRRRTRVQGTTVARLAHAVVYEAKEAVLAAVPDDVTFTGRVIGVKQLQHMVILKLEDPNKDGSIEVLAPGDANVDDVTPGKLVTVRGRCDVQADPQGATMRLIVRASSFSVIAALPQEVRTDERSSPRRAPAADRKNRATFGTGASRAAGPSAWRGTLNTCSVRGPGRNLPPRTRRRRRRTNRRRRDVVQTS